MSRTVHFLAMGLAVLSLTACVGLPSPDQRRDKAEAAVPSFYQPRHIATDEFDLYALTPHAMKASSSGTLTVLLEGDGLAFIRPNQPSQDPTPTKQIVVDFLPTGRSDIAYLARPCQFTADPARNCDMSLWTEARYSKRVIDSMGEALTLLKREAGATGLHLIGYSGGGVVAALLAARRDDIVSFVALAAPLDTEAFTAHHRVTPLSGSLNPRDDAARLARVPQIIVVGGRDEIVPREVVDSYVAALPQKDCVDVLIVANAEHGADWSKMLPALVDLVPRCAETTMAEP